MALGALNCHSPGEEAAILASVSGPGLDFVSEAADLEFRVGKGLNLGHKIVTGHQLWFASMGIQYQVDGEGEVYAEISSTNIPNVTLYFDWKAVAEYSLQDITVEQVEDFLTAKKRKQPPQREDRFSVTGKTGEEPAVGYPPLASDVWFRDL